VQPQVGERVKERDQRHPEHRGASFWPELLAANPHALVLLSVRDPEEWYRSASGTVFLGLDDRIADGPPGMSSWMDAVRRLLGDRFSDQFDDQGAMMDAFERHNAKVRNTVPAGQLLEWTQPFPLTNTSEEFWQRFGIANR
jgi:hypothetical protein